MNSYTTLYASGSLVKARGREWVVMPESRDDLLILKPLGGTDDETTGIYLPLETVESATFKLPTPDDLGDYRSARLLRNAVKLGFRNSAGPFRCFGSIAVEPRPYQLVPLLMALKMDPIRMLISDDVGIGKTIEACMIVKELMARGEITGFSVLCPAQLAEQWQSELKHKFHIDAELVLPRTVRALETKCKLNQSIFEKYPVTIVSLDFIKSDRNRSDFIRACSNTVIVDEAHSCSSKGTKRHQRYNLVKELSKNKERNMIFVTATPHSGNEDAFRSLITLLKPEFKELPAALAGKENEHHRRNLAKHFIQRTRGDIIAYMDENTSFPEREDSEQGYLLSNEYKNLFNQVIEYTRDSVTKAVKDHGGRVRYWSALALLRALASSPSAAAATLRNRSITEETKTPEEADEVGRRTVLDLDLETMEEPPDIIPGSKTQDSRLKKLQKTAEAITPEQDEKLRKAIKLIQKHLKEGFHPIVFCRFIDTAEYVTSHLRKKMKKASIECVTGTLPHEERERIIEELSQKEQRVLVCTDCLSEGINLQDGFNAVIHYDLSWNPMRHEQRAGRVDRFGQKSPTVRVTNYYGEDNGIDERVMKVLLRKHQSIRNSLGISVPIPGSTSEIMEALIEDLFNSTNNQMLLTGFESYMTKTGNEIFKKWDKAEEREKQSRTMFRQLTIKVDEVARELKEAREATGSGISIEEFVTDALKFHGGIVTKQEAKPISLNLTELPDNLKDALEITEKTKNRQVTFNFPAKNNEEYISRTHPFVENLAGFIVDTTMDSQTANKAGRCGVIRTDGIQTRTTLVLTRNRYHINNLLTEDTQLTAFTGTPENPTILTKQEAEALLTLKPQAQVNPDLAKQAIKKVTEQKEKLQKLITEIAKQKGKEILNSHTRVRAAKKQTEKPRIKLQEPPDILGIYIFLPVPGGIKNA
ncbi:MAG: DEAD/DEAH box helicase family protein [Candidatus Sabulitectum sp.]|nr:DEAD/DEAH box helicase family protein [Candidatus Sabulitectum sp.]